MTTRPRLLALLTLLLLVSPLAVARALAWPASLMEVMSRDARKLLPRSLARLFAEREKEMLEEARRFPPSLSQPLWADLQQGRLQPETLAALDSQAAAAVELFRKGRVSDGVLHLGALLRIPADVSDPVLSVGPEGYPPGLIREYYAFIEANREKIPLVLDDEAALRLRRKELPAYWQSLLDRSRSQSPVLRIEMFHDGRVVSHRVIDYRSPVFGVASLSYSRAVTAIAATWLALWRDSRGDVTRIPSPRPVRPQDRGPTPPEAP